MNSWIVWTRPNPTPRLRLFCFPYGGGGALIYRTWSNALPADIEVCPVQLPGRESRFREAPFSSVRPLIGTLLEVMPPYLDRPFAFFGHSMGALIGFELARALRRRNGPMPLKFFVSGRRAPQLPNPGPDLHRLDDDELVRELGRFGGTPEGVLKNPELMRAFIPLLRADFAITETYVYTDDAPLDCPIYAFGGLEDKEVGREQLAAWRTQTTSTFSMTMFPGDHFFINAKLADLLRTLSQIL